MKKIILLDKKEGETPLEALEKFRTSHKEYKDIPMTYAGRLDPMAEGVLLILAGEETKNKEKYLGLSKEYEFQVLFGFSTDTYDILGKIIHSHILKNVGMSDFKKNVEKNLKYFRGTFIQTYPAYSSKTVKGKALFAYAREGIEVEAPVREVNVKSLKLEKIGKIKSEKLLKDITKRIAKVNGPARNAKGIAFAGGDFRQKEIMNMWQKELLKKKEEFYIADFKIACSSGTYVRGIANALGERLSVPALAFSIKRTKLGKWYLDK